MTRWAMGDIRAPYDVARWLVAVARSIERIPKPPARD
jgi:hypothetical protein